MEANKKNIEAKEAYQKSRNTADTVITLHPDSISWSSAQLTIILTPFKTKNEGTMPTLKKKK